MIERSFACRGDSTRAREVDRTSHARTARSLLYKCTKRTRRRASPPPPSRARLRLRRRDALRDRSAVETLGRGEEIQVRSREGPRDRTASWLIRRGRGGSRGVPVRRWSRSGSRHRRAARRALPARAKKPFVHAGAVERVTARQRPDHLAAAKRIEADVALRRVGTVAVAPTRAVEGGRGGVEALLPVRGVGRRAAMKRARRRRVA